MAHQNTAIRPTRPRMPTDMDERRSQHQFVRSTILRDDYDDTLRAWMEEHVDTERLEVWGVPDTSANPLADLSRQMSTPGLYGVRPTWRHANEANDGLVGPGGQLDKSGYHTRMQWVQYMALGMGDYLIRMDVDRHGDLTVRPVSPHNVYVRAAVDAPDIPVELWELQLRYWMAQKRWVYTWDVYDLGDENTPPSFRIHLAAQKGGLDDDLSNIFLRHAGGESGEMVGEAYPWVRENGTARLPYNFKHAVDTGMIWNEHDKRGVHRGTLNSGLYWTYTGHAALAATGGLVLVAGLDPVSVDVHAPDSQISTTITRGVRTLKATPGAILYHDLQEGVTPLIKEIGPGVNLEVLHKFASGYEQRQQIRYGLPAADAEKKAANPTSGTALHISRQVKREFAAQVEPLFRRSDLDAVELAAIVLKAAGSGFFDESGYSITYKEVPRSPGEEQARRDGLEWKVDQGVMSKAEMFQELNPGTSVADAVQALVNARLLNARVEAMTVAALESAGLAAPAEDTEDTPPAGSPAEE